MRGRSFISLICLSAITCIYIYFFVFKITKSMLFFFNLNAFLRFVLAKHMRPSTGETVLTRRYINKFAYADY